MKSKYLLFILLINITACKIPAITGKEENKNVPAYYKDTLTSTNNDVSIQWRKYYADPFLISLIDTALKNNQELNITLREIEIDRNEIKARKGEYLPFVNFVGAAGYEKTPRYTWNGLSEEDLKANPEKGPKYIGDFMIGVYASWELDVWGKLRKAKKAAVLNYLSSTEGKNFMVTNIIAEISSSYYELLALDNLLAIIHQNIELQKNALRIVKLEKDAAKVSQLAVNRFEAQLLNTENLAFDIQQRIIETENKINFLTGRFPQRIQRTNDTFNDIAISPLQTGIPSQLLQNRPDIRRAELALAASKLDVEVARANFYPSFRLTSVFNLSAFNPSVIIRPESILYNLAADAVAPLINKNAIKAIYQNANEKQVISAYNYERSILTAYIEVVNQLSKMENYSKSYVVKSKEVDILTQSIDISNKLFTSARADYLEVLLTQREALDSKIELIETKLMQLQAKVNIYRALGGGWN